MALPLVAIIFIAVAAIIVCTSSGAGVAVCCTRGTQQTSQSSGQASGRQKRGPQSTTGGSNDGSSNIGLRRRSPGNQANSVRNLSSTDELWPCEVCGLPGMKVRLFPCGHTGICANCADNLNLDRDGCPCCGAEIEGVDEETTSL